MRELTGPAKAFAGATTVGPVSVTEALLKPLLAADPARPLITHYDDAAGTRIELSRATMANWAAKTANWLRDELDVEPGGRVAVLLPPHWQTVGILLGAWWCGAEVTTDVDGADVVLVPPTGLPDSAPAPGTATVVAAVSLDPMGRGLPNPPAGTLDYITEARVYGDDFVPWDPVSPDTTAIPGRTVRDIRQSATSRATEFAITDHDRVLSTVDFTAPENLVDGLLAILTAGAALVQVTNPNPDTLAARATTEKVTATLGVTLPNIRHLA